MRRVMTMTMTMTMITPPECQGQMVEVSYGWIDGRLYQRTVDHSDRSVSWAVADDRGDRLPESWHPVNGAPDLPSTAWIPCAEPIED